MDSKHKLTNKSFPKAIHIMKALRKRKTVAELYKAVVVDTSENEYAKAMEIFINSVTSALYTLFPDFLTIEEVTINLKASVMKEGDEDG